MWTIEVAGNDKCYSLYEDSYGHTKYLKKSTALTAFRKIKLKPWHYKRLLLDGAVVRVHIGFPER